MHFGFRRKWCVKMGLDPWPIFDIQIFYLLLFLIKFKNGNYFLLPTADLINRYVGRINFINVFD